MKTGVLPDRQPFNAKDWLGENPLYETTRGAAFLGDSLELLGLFRQAASIWFSLLRHMHFILRKSMGTRTSAITCAGFFHSQKKSYAS
jgi:hypothetical protein